MTISSSYIHSILIKSKEMKLNANDHSIIVNIENFYQTLNGSLSELTEAELNQLLIILLEINDAACSKKFLSSLALLRKEYSDLKHWPINVVLYKNGYLNKTNQTLFSKVNDPDVAVAVIEGLAKNKLLNNTNLELISHHTDLDQIIIAIFCLKRDEILNHKNFDAVIKHEQPKKLAIGLWDLANHEILTLKNRNALALSQQPIHAAKLLRKLNQNDLLEKYRNIITSDLNLKSLLGVVTWLDKAKLFNELNLIDILKNKNIELIAESLIGLPHLLASTIFNIISQHAHPKEASDTIKVFYRLKLLTPKRLETIRTCLNLKELACAIEYLRENNIHSELNIEYIEKSQSPELSAQIIKKLMIHGLYSIENLALVCKSENPIESFTLIKEKYNKSCENDKRLEKILHTLTSLQFLGYLDKERFEFIVSNQDPEAIYSKEPELKTIYSEDNNGANNETANNITLILDYLRKNELLIVENYQCVLEVRNQNCAYLVDLCKKLSNANVFTQASFNFIFNKRFDDPLIQLISLFSDANILNQLTLDILFSEKSIDDESKQKLDKYFLENLLLADTLEDKKKLNDLFNLAKINQFVSNRFVSFFERNKDELPELIIEDLFNEKKYGKELFRYTLNPAKKLSDKVYFRLLNLAYTHAEFSQVLLEEYGRLDEIQFLDGGISTDTWYKSTDELLRRTPAPHKRDLSQLTDELTGGKKVNLKTRLSLRDQIIKENWRFLRIQGRTILFEDNERNIFAFKIQKEKEDENELIKEFHTNNYLNKEAKKLDLKGKLPIPQSINEVTDVLDYLKQQLDEDTLNEFLDMTGNKNVYTAYAYKINHDNRNYFTYLHEINLTDEEFNQANAIAVHDLCQLLKVGIVYPQLADIFHNKDNPFNRRDRGRYIILANLLSPWVLATHRKPAGNGRTSNWPGAVEFPNIRYGLADYGDCITTNDLLFGSEWVDKFFKPAEQTYQDQLGNYLLVNELAEYQYILFLIAGRRGCTLTEIVKNKISEDDDEAKAKLEVKIKNIWYKLAQQVFMNCVQMVTNLSGLSENETSAFLARMVSVDRLARQMQFWMTDEHVPYLEKNEIPQDIYDDGTEVTIDNEKFRENTFTSKVGCSIDHIHPDLGLVNSQEPIKEANKLFYWMNNLILSSYHNHKLTCADVKKVVKAKDAVEFEKIRPQLFSHLSARKYYAGQLCLLNEMKNKILPKEQSEVIEKEIQHHKLKSGVLAVQTLWRKGKCSKLNLNERKEINFSTRKIYN